MKPNFSETQFAFAVIHEFLDAHSNCKFFIPTQRQEKSYGYDVKLKSTKGIPIFYQFKVSEYLGPVGIEYKHFNQNYFRFHTYKCQPYENQHNILFKLNKLGDYSKVFYVAPCFCDINDFYTYFSTNSVIRHSKFIRLKKLFEITNTSTHSICYTNNGIVKMFSDNECIDDNGALSFDQFEASFGPNDTIDSSKFISALEDIDEFSNIFDSIDNNIDLCFAEIGKRLSQHNIVFAWLYFD